MNKTLDIINTDDAQAKVSDVKVIGNPDNFQLLCKASSKDQGWMKSTKAMYIEGVGCIVQSSTQQGDNVAEALTFVPGVKVVNDVNDGHKLTLITAPKMDVTFNINSAGINSEELMRTIKEVQEQYR